MLDAANVPGIALGSTMMGFASIARESGFDFWMTFFTSLSVWGMPGQVAFVSLYATGASMFLMFVAVALANMRMMLMVISGSDILRLGVRLAIMEAGIDDAFAGHNQLGADQLQAKSI